MAKTDHDLGGWASSADLLSRQPDRPAVRKYGTVTKLDVLPEPRQVRFVISTGDVDRDNDTIDANGWDLASYKNNPVVLFGHDHRGLPIGKCASIGVENGQLVAVAEFASYPFAQTVYDLVQGGFLRATSVGFRALEYDPNEERRGIDFKRQELLEFSVVPVPANPHALIAASASGVDLEPLRKWMADLLADWPGELKLPGKAWEKVLGAAAKHAGSGPSTTISASVDVHTASAHEKIAALSQALDELEAKAETVAATMTAALPGQKEPASPESDAIVLELDDPDPAVIDLDVEELNDAMRAAVRDSFRSVVLEATTRTLNQMRGRLE